MNAPASPEEGRESHLSKPRRKSSGRWLGLWLAAALVLAGGLPLAYLAFTPRPAAPPSATSAPAPGISGGHVTVYGEVTRQGKYYLAPGDHLTASQVVLQAGGFGPSAKDKAVKIVRKVPGKGNVTIVVNLRDVMTKGRLDKDVPIHPDDTVIVEKKLINF